MPAKQHFMAPRALQQRKILIMTKLNRAAFAALFASALLFFPPGLGAYNPSVRYFDKDAYRAATQNWAAECNSERIAFFANNSGVLIFDSAEWKTVHNHNRTNVRSLWFDREENVLYAGSTNELGKISSGGGSLTYTSLLDTLGVTVSEVWDIGKIDGKLFFQDDRHIYVFENAGDADGRTGLKTYRFDDRIFCSEVIGGELLIYVHGIGCLRLTDGAFEAIRGTEPLKDFRVCSIQEARDGSLMFITRTNGVFRLRDGRLSPEALPFSEELRENIVYTAASDGSTIAFGTVSNGVYILNSESGEWYNINIDSGLGNNTVLNLRFDPTGNIWVCLDNGLAYINLSAAERELFGKDELYGTGYAAALWKGQLYLGTNQGLFRTPYPISPNGEYSRVTRRVSQVWDLSIIGGDLFCCNDGGVFILYSDGSTQDIPLGGAWKLESPPGREDLLVGSSYDRFFALKRTASGKWAFSHFIKGTIDPSKAFCFDAKGRMWLSHWVKGLFRISFDEDYTTVLSNVYFSTLNGFPTPANNIPNKLDGKIIFSTEGGFYSYDDILQKAVPVDSLNSRFTFCPVVATVLRLPGGDAFYSSGALQALGYRDSTGGQKIDSLSLKYLVGRRPLGFECSLPLEDGRLLLNTEKGFSIIDTDAIKNRGTENSPLIIRSITGIRGAEEHGVLDNYSSAPLPEIVLSPDENTLKFTFLMVEPRMSNAVTYSCFLEGYDSDWSRPGFGGTKEYTHLPYGTHRFKVRAYNILTGQTAETAVGFHIRWPWYLSWWALALYTLLAALLVFALERAARSLYRRRLAEVAAKKEKEMEEKRMKEDLLTKANELATSTMNLLRKNEELIDIQEELGKVERMVRTEEKSEKILSQLGEIRDGIDSNIRHDEDWKRFEKNFDIVYDEYLTRLGNAYPELTLGDKKLCAYLKMGLSSKEIAPLMNLTFRSVEMTRYRLRKKLDLSRDQNLIDFLQKF